MSDDMPDRANGFAWSIKRIVEVFDAINKIGLPLVLVGLGIASYYGWIASPFSTLPLILRDHDTSMVKLLADRERYDSQILAVITTLRTDMLRNSAVYRIRVCAEIRDADVRKRCLEA